MKLYNRDHEKRHTRTHIINWRDSKSKEDCVEGFLDDIPDFYLVNISIRLQASDHPRVDQL